MASRSAVVDSGPATRADERTTAAIRLARRQFLAGERVKLHQLASDLQITRMTLHRWLGNRDQLLGEVLWSIADPTIKRARAETPERGGHGIALTMRRFLDMVCTADFMLAFLEREPETALAVLTTKRSSFQQRVVKAIAEMLTFESEAGYLTPPMDIDDLAYVIVRILEAFTYTSIITDGRPDPQKAQQALEALLR